MNDESSSAVSKLYFYKCITAIEPRLMNYIFECKFSIHRRSISMLKTSTKYKTAILCELNVFENILAVFFPVQLLNFK